MPDFKHNETKRGQAPARFFLFPVSVRARVADVDLIDVIYESLQIVYFYFEEALLNSHYSWRVCAIFFCLRMFIIIYVYPIFLIRRREKSRLPVLHLDKIKTRYESFLSSASINEPPLDFIAKSVYSLFAFKILGKGKENDQNCCYFALHRLGNFCSAFRTTTLQ